MPKLCAPSTFTSERAFCINTLRQSFPRMTPIQGQSGQEEITSVFGFWLMADENIDFLTQYLASNMIFGDA